jgi:hypothetical protein
MLYSFFTHAQICMSGNVGKVKQIKTLNGIATLTLNKMRKYLNNTKHIVFICLYIQTYKHYMLCIIVLTQRG